MRKVFLCALVSLVVLSQTALAVPLLQLYVEGGEYDAATETWVVETNGDPIRLWVIGNVDGPGGQPIYDVRLAAAYESPESGIDPVFTITGSTTGGYGGFTDPSQASDPTYLQTVTDGSTPILDDGTPLGPHGIYGAGTDWQEFALGDFDLIDSPLADFMSAFPAAGDIAAQINVYEITVSGGSGWIHFDAYNHIAAGNSVFAPFSHDAQAVPEPATAVALACIGLGGLVGRSKLRRLLRH